MNIGSMAHSWTYRQFTVGVPAGSIMHGLKVIFFFDPGTSLCELAM